MISTYGRDHQITVLSPWTAAQMREWIEAENLAPRHQLRVVCCSAPERVRLRCSDRLFFVWLYRLWPGVLDLFVIVKPDTVVRWHRRGFKAFWRWKSRCAPGKPRIPREIQDLIREVSLANPLWGAPRIHGELLKVGVDVAHSTVARYIVKRRRPPSQSWNTFLRNHADGIAVNGGGKRGHAAEQKWATLAR